MDEQFSSNATNFGNALQTQVDPRTGQFMLNFPVAELVGNHQLGPELSLSLKYSPLNNKNEGFGIGFSIGLTQFNNRTHSLNLSNGEEYRVMPGSDKILHQKLNNFHFCYANGRDEEQGYKILWKDGKKEYLSIVADDETFVTASICSPLDRRMNFAWNWSGQYAQLVRIEDEFCILCEIIYSTNVQIKIWPNTSDAFKLTFNYINADYLNVISRTVSDSNTFHWNFIYDAIGHMKTKLTLTGVNYPTGMRDTVEYHSKDGLQFPTNSNIDLRLPCVHTHTRYTGFDQPKTITHYEYTKQNFLGYNGDFGDWSCDTDNLYTTLTDYIYGSTEKSMNGDISITIERTYNNYHLLIAEEVNRQNHIHRTEYTYYAVKYCFFNGQPSQFQLPKEKKVIIRDPMGNVRTLITLNEFDKNGNPIRELNPNGTEIITTWYKADGEHGCPAEPNGFVRFMKEQRIIPCRITGSESEHSIKYCYAKLGNTNYVIQKRKKSYCNDLLLGERHWEYNESKKYNDFGRIVSISNTLYNLSDMSKCYTSIQNFQTKIRDNQMTQTIIFTGHDGLQQTSIRCQSAVSSRLYSEISAQGIKTEYVYDLLGRLICRTICSNSEYENVITWEYYVDSKGLHSIKCDTLGNKTKTSFDGAGRPMCLQNFDAETGKWYETAACVRNSFGEIIMKTAKDWLTNMLCKKLASSMDSTVTHDGWGMNNVIHYSDGKKHHQQIDRINLTETVYTEGITGPHSLTSSSVTTIKDRTSEFPIIKIMKDAMGKEHSRCHYTWNGLGQLLVEQDELKAVTIRTYDPYGRVLTQTLPDGTILKRTYAAHLTGNQIASVSVTGKNTDGNVHTWLLGSQKFDSLGRLIECTSGGRITSYSYQGSLTVPSIVTLASGKIVAYTYIPELGNVISSVTTDGITQNFHYAKKTGKLLTAQEAGSKIVNNWSRNGQLKEEMFTLNGHTRRAEYTYTLNGAPVTYTDITGKKMQYIMDEHGRIVQIIDDSLRLELTYDNLGHLSTQKIKSHNSCTFVTTALNYDSFGRECKRSIVDNNDMILIVSQTWQKNGLLSTRTTEKNGFKVRQEKFNYDNRNRVISYQVSGDSLPMDSYGILMTSQTYQYDALNNIISMKTVLFDNATDVAKYHYLNNADPTQLTKVTHTHKKYPKNINLRYDIEGRMICDEAGRLLTYDVIGRLTNINGKNGHSGIYGYDALNRQIVRKNINNNEIQELYYRGSELVNEVINPDKHETRLIKLGHNCVGVYDSSGLTLTVSDKNNNLLWSKNANADNKDSKLHVWSPYGNGTSDNNNRLPGFTGERFDQVSGTYHLGNGYRAYNPILMRFNCPDSLSPFSAGGINPYAYCAGDPVNHTDPSGHLSWQAITGIIASVIGIGLSIFTAGSSIAAAGGVMAAISSTSAVSLVIGALGIASDVTGLLSGALEDVNPEAASILGWISLATGVIGMAKGIKDLGGFMKRKFKYRGSQSHKYGTG